MTLHGIPTHRHEHSCFNDAPGTGSIEGQAYRFVLSLVWTLFAGHPKSKLKIMCIHMNIYFVQSVNDNHLSVLQSGQHNLTQLIFQSANGFMATCVVSKLYYNNDSTPHPLHQNRGMGLLISTMVNVLAKTS